ncbi:MAG: protein phosphatase 2C domain-containing protein [Myxococcota bacterium]
MCPSPSRDASDAPTLVAAVDGLGAPGREDRAAKLVVTAIERKVPLLDKLARATERDRTSGTRLALVRSLERTFDEIHSELAALQDPQVGATLAVAVFTDGYAHLAHVGAVRGYLLRDGRLRALTTDHTLGMVRVRAGTLSPEAYRASPLRHRLYQALGTGGTSTSTWRRWCWPTATCCCCAPTASTTCSTRPRSATACR